MERFRVLEHTADIGFEAFGATREELFRNAGLALIDLIVDLKTIAPGEELAIEVRARDSAGLLVNWLSEILYLHDTGGWLFCNFELQTLRDDLVSAVARGERFDRTRHQAKLLVKAITYHQLALGPTAEGWRARVYVDI